MSLFWTVDSDGERRHRLQDEWDGNKGPWWETGTYVSEACHWQVSLGATWSSWGLGIDVGWDRDAEWGRFARIPYRRHEASAQLGPWYVEWTWCKPLATPEGGAA